MTAWRAGMRHGPLPLPARALRVRRRRQAPFAPPSGDRPAAGCSQRGVPLRRSALNFSPPTEAGALRIEKVHIRNLRAAKDLEVTLDDTTALVGANGSGKSTILLALRVFFGETAVSAGDYHNENTGDDIVITAAFGRLGPAARAQFSEYVGGDDRLEISCIVHWDGSRAVRTLHGSAPQNPDFAAVLSETREAVAKPLYEALAARPEYAGLPLPWPGIQEAAEALRKWEDAHPDRCRRMPDGGNFFGPGGDGHARLSHFVRLLHVPAEHGAAGGAGSALGALLDITIQKTLGEKEEYMALPGKIKEAYKKAMDSVQSEKLRLADTLSVTLDGLVPGAYVEILGRPPEPSVGRPRFDAYLVENRYSSPAAAAGHGIQRALAIAALHHLSRARADGESYAKMAYRRPIHKWDAQAQAAPPRAPADADGGDIRDAPAVVLAIEEPELYQHPTRVRHLASLLRSLPDGGIVGAPGPVQVVYTTHSPHFVFADSIGQIRLVSMRQDSLLNPGTTAVASATPSDILEDMRRCGAARATDGAVDYSLLRAMGPAASEGFFASAVVLVEGPSDRIVLEAAAEARGRSMDSLGVSVVPCEAKSAMPLPIAVFRRFGIPVYAVWDADENKGRQKEESERIASALGHADGKWRGRICGQFACLEGDLEATVASDLEKALGSPGPSGPHHKRILRERRALHGIRKKDSKTINARLLMEEVKENNIRLETIDEIVRQIEVLAEGGAAGA